MLANINYWTNGETVEYVDGEEQASRYKKSKKERRCSENRELKLYPFQAIQSNKYEKRHYPTGKQFLESFIEENGLKFRTFLKQKHLMMNMILRNYVKQLLKQKEAC